MSSSKKVLSIGDTVLYEDDVALLEPGNWLNDNLIGFYFEYLQQKDTNADGDVKKVEFIHPTVMMLATFTDDDAELDEILAPLKLKEKNVVVIPINNNQAVTKVGGSHWSLLVFENGVFTHYDSCNNMNKIVAQRTAKKFASHLGVDKGDVKFVADGFRGESQANSSDCGVYLIAIAERIKTGEPINGITRKLICDKRNQIKKLIATLASKK